MAVAVILLAMGTTAAGAATRYVPSQYSTIQSAINACNNGDVIIVAPGTYYERINFNGKNIVLSSVDPNDQSIVDTTVIDGSKAGTVVTFNHGESRSCQLAGFTIKML